MAKRLNFANFSKIIIVSEESDSVVIDTYWLLNTYTKFEKNYWSEFGDNP